MEVIVHDTVRGLLDLAALPLPQRAGALRNLLNPLYSDVPLPGDPIDAHHQGGGFRGPWSSMVSSAEFDRAYLKIVGDIGLAGMRHTPSYVLGDTAARRFGQEPRGIPDMAGYAVGLHIVDAHLAASGLTAAASTILPSTEILLSSGLEI